MHPSLKRYQPRGVGPVKSSLLRNRFTCACLLLLFGITSCAAPSGPSHYFATSSDDPNIGFNSSATDVDRLARLWEQRTRYSVVNDYPIGPGDVLQVSVPAMEEIRDRDARVAADGTLSLPFIGRLHAQGLTQEELADALRQRLKEYLRNPRVFVFVKESNSRQVAVLGAVARPGLYSLTSGSENIFDMIARAGGVLSDADPRIQFIPTEPLRGDAAREVVSALPVALKPSHPGITLLKKTEPIYVDVQELSSGGHQLYLSLPVRPGDTIMVPGGAQVLVEGWVEKPGAYKMSPGLTLAAVVAAAGGQMFAASSSDVRVLRGGRDGKKIALTADLDRIKSGEVSDIGLQGGDIVHVSYSTAKLIPWGIYGLLRDVINIGFGGAIP